MSLVPVDPKSEASVVTLLEHAAQWLSEAVHRGEPGEIAAIKAQVATAAEATKQLNLSKDIQLDALEMVRRAEYALGKAIRRGQAEGTIMTEREAKSIAGKVRQHGVTYAEQQPAKPRPLDFMERHEWNNTHGGVSELDVDPNSFELIISEAKADGNLSRTNVVRKVRDTKSSVTAGSAAGVGTIRSPQLRQERADLIAELAAQGYSSRQMPVKVGVTEVVVRRIARDFGIEIPADRSMTGTRRIDSTRIVTQTATALEGLAMGIDLIDYASLDPKEVGQWIDSLTTSVNALSKAVKKIKESIQ